MPNIQALKTAINNKNCDQIKLLISLSDFYLNCTFREFSHGNGRWIGLLHFAVDTDDVQVVTTLLQYGRPKGLTTGLGNSDIAQLPILNYFLDKKVNADKSKVLPMLYVLLAHGAGLERAHEIKHINVGFELKIKKKCLSEAILRGDQRIGLLPSELTLEELRAYCKTTTEKFGRRKVQEDDINAFIANWYNPGNDVVAHRNALHDIKALLLDSKYFDVTHSVSSKNSVRELAEIIAELIYHRGGLSSSLIGDAYCKYHAVAEEPAGRKMIYSYKNLTNYLESAAEVLIADFRCKPGIAAAIEELAKNPYTGEDNRKICQSIIRQSAELTLDVKLSMEMQCRIIEATSQTKTELSKVKRRMHRQEKKIKKLVQAHETKDAEIQQLQEQLAKVSKLSVLPEKSESEIAQNTLFAKTHIRKYSM